MSNGLLFASSNKRGPSSGDVPSYRALQEEVVVIWSSVRLGCLVIVQHQYQQQSASSARQAWGDPRVLDAACVKTRGVLAQRPPSSLHPRHPPSDRAAGVSLSSPRLVLSRHLETTCPLLPHLLVSLGSAPGSRVARPRRNTATFASPPMACCCCIMVNGTMSSGPGGRQIRDCML